jgi:hypothetical protein
LNVYGLLDNDGLNFVDFLGLGEWKVTPHTVDLSDPQINVRATDQSGFQVAYMPSPGECKDGKIILYQIVSNTGLLRKDPHVDGTVGKVCKLPPGMTPQGDSPCSYQDSPGDANQFGVGTWRLTAVAVCRKNCKDTILSTRYFEFDNSKRQPDVNVNPNNKKHLEDGLDDWVKKKGGAR